jgi:hypothetical protein
MIKEYIGILLVFSSIFDAVKYYWAGTKILQLKSAKGHSRKFLNAAIFNDIVKLSYGITILDLFIIISSILALLTMGYNYYVVYRFYPYKYRNLLNFKRPPLWIYIINSLIPNKYRKKL